jgi:hypothetical protein
MCAASAASSVTLLYLNTCTVFSFQVGSMLKSSFTFTLSIASTSVSLHAAFQSNVSQLVARMTHC